MIFSKKLYIQLFTLTLSTISIYLSSAIIQNEKMHRKGTENLLIEKNQFVEWNSAYKSLYTPLLQKMKKKIHTRRDNLILYIRFLHEKNFRETLKISLLLVFFGIFSTLPCFKLITISLIKKYKTEYYYLL